MKKFKIGDIVYSGLQNTFPGKVIEINGDAIMVRWNDKTIHYYLNWEISEYNIHRKIKPTNNHPYTKIFV